MTAAGQGKEKLPHEQNNQVLSEKKIGSGRFIDTAAIPNAGFITASPDLSQQPQFGAAGGLSPRNK